MAWAQHGPLAGNRVINTTGKKRTEYSSLRPNQLGDVLAHWCCSPPRPPKLSVPRAPAQPRGRAAACARPLPLDLNEVPFRGRAIETPTVVIKDPQVKVKVTGFRSQRVQVTGEVKNPGLVAIDDTPKGILEAINERGGLAPTASHRSVVLIRKEKFKTKQLYRIDLRELLSGDHPGRNPAIMGGDIIHVPDLSSDQIFVLGEVTRPQLVPMADGAMTITQAIATANGMAPLTGNDSGIVVFRLPDPNADARRRPLSSSSTADATGVLLAGQFELQRR